MINNTLELHKYLSVLVLPEQLAKELLSVQPMNKAIDAFNKLYAILESNPHSYFTFSKVN